MNGFYSDEHGFYLVSEMVALCSHKTPHNLPLTSLLHNMAHQCWDGDCTPWQVLRDHDPENFKKHKRRIQDADLQYPLVVSAVDYNVLDGMHRLCKAQQQGLTTLPCFLLTRQEMRSLRRSLDEVLEVLQ